MRHSLVALTPIAILFAAGASTAGAADEYGDELGAVDFPVSCNERAQPLMARGLALLHHMTYAGARQVFEDARETDPDCALAYWGIAMTAIHPIWPDTPSEDVLIRGQELVELAKVRGRRTPREQAYIAALDAYYTDALERGEPARLASFDRAWAKIHHEFPDDLEAAAFAALAHLATASFLDKSYRKQETAGTIAEHIQAQNPEHPGAHHYLIHAYDFPGLADRALDVARRYGDLAPEVPHALHMPTHIFTRLGLWPESIAWNRRAAAAAWKSGVIGASSYLHALDYLAYAYLQRAQDEKAEEILAISFSLPPPFYESKGAAFAYALAAMPARYNLERREWAAAAKLEPGQPALFSWGDRFPGYQAITHFARALGAARSGDLPAARRALEELDTLHERAAGTSAYWAHQIEIQQITAWAWLTLAEGNLEEALKLMRRAAELEAATGKHPVTPGEVLPARELLGDMLLELERPEEALISYEVVLARAPNRFNSLFGAGWAAELGGDPDKATEYYQRLLAVAAEADTERPRLRHARLFLE